METNKWHINASIIILVLAIFCCYYLVSGFKGNKKTWCFWLAIALLLLVTCAPQRYLGLSGEFSAHMTAHVILLLLCGPLLVLSIPSRPALRTLKPLLIVSSFFNRYSWIAWLIGVGIMWLWHVPAIITSPGGQNMLLHSGSLLLCGMMFSWPLFGPVASDHLHPMAGVVYLFTACISCSLLGLLIAFAPAKTFGNYAITDQQTAGLIMWVPCCFAYLGGCVYLLMRWFAEKAGDVAHNFDKLNNSLEEHGRRR